MLWCMLPGSFVRFVNLLTVPRIGYKKESIPDFTRIVNIENPSYLELNHC